MDLTAVSARKPPMSLQEAVDRYLSAAGSYGMPVSLRIFGLSREATEQLFSAFDEDYHISRFLKFSNSSGESYRINGFLQTHVSIEEEIQSIL
jgi:hypothetical protein